MNNYRYPSPEQLPSEATVVDYLKYLKLESVSVVTAAHLAHQLVPIINSEHAFLFPFMGDVRNTYEQLCEAVDKDKIMDVKFENGQFNAPLMIWFKYLIEIDHPMPNLVLEICEIEALSIKKSAKYQKLKNHKNIVNSSDAVSHKIREKLKEEIIRLDENYPKIALKHYRYYPGIEVLVREAGLDNEESFTNFASSAIPRPRPPGRPRRQDVDEYAKPHPELKKWFDQIKSQMK
jgi:hypothetical protein